MRRILYIDYLDELSRTIGIFSKPFFSEVVFHNAEEKFRSEYARQKLERSGIRWLSYHGIPVSVWCRSFQKLNIKLGKAVVKNRFLCSPIYKKSVEYFRFDKNGLNKLNASLAGRVSGNWIKEGTSSFSLIEYIYSESNIRIYYMPRFIENYLLAIEKGGRIKPVIFHVLINFLWINLKNLMLYIPQYTIEVINKLF